MESVTKNPVWQKVAEVELVYHNVVKPSQRPRILSSKEAYNVLMASWDSCKIEYVEQFKIVLLNHAKKVLGVFEVSTGSMSSTLADPKIIFTAALKGGASCILLSHNHPSGNLKPSDADLQLTKKIVEGGKLLDIRVIDHLIVTTEGYYSFADEGLL